MTKRIAQAITFLLASQILPVAANIAGPYVMLVDRGFGWREAGEFDDLRECETEAAEYAVEHKAQAGCTTARSFERWQGERTFHQIALACAASTGVHIVVLPGRRVDVHGTQQRQRDFKGCLETRASDTPERLIRVVPSISTQQPILRRDRSRSLDGCEGSLWIAGQRGRAIPEARVATRPYFPTV